MKIVRTRGTVFLALLIVASIGPIAAPELLHAEQIGAGNVVAAAGQAAAAAAVGATEKLEKASLIVTTDYWIGPEDVLDITVWRNADLSKQVTVRPDGRISLPLVGDITAVGKTAAELAEVISAKLKEFKENPQVSIVVKEVNSYAIYVLGEVARPARYPLKSKTTILQAITLAGGFLPTAARNKLVVFRFSENGERDVKIRASYDDIVLRDGAGQNVTLKPGDTLVVPSENMVLVP